jgi:hypothetical protein
MRTLSLDRPLPRKTLAAIFLLLGGGRREHFSGRQAHSRQRPKTWPVNFRRSLLQI